MRNKVFLLIIISILSSFVLFSLYAYAEDYYSNEQIADAIYKTEGGKKARVLYGILSIKTTNPKQVCLNTIKNHRLRHKKHSCKLDFIVCLGNRYCPPSVDFIGNKNWTKNVKWWLRKNE